MPYRTVSEVMTSTVVSIGPDATYREIVQILTAYRVSAVPVLDGDGRPLGVVSATDLLRKVEFGGASRPPGLRAESGERSTARTKAAAATAAELMSAPAFTISRDMSIAAAARMMDSLGVKRLSVVDRKRRVVGIVTRTDLLRVFLQPDDAIRADVLAEVAGRVPAEQTEAVRVEVAGGVVALTGELRWRSEAESLARLARSVPGVVDVDDRVRYRYDDVDGYPEQ